MLLYVLFGFLAGTGPLHSLTVPVSFFSVPSCTLTFVEEPHLLVCVFVCVWCSLQSIVGASVDLSVHAGASTGVGQVFASSFCFLFLLRVPFVFMTLFL